MWDNPRLLNATAGFLVGLVVLAFALVGMNWLLRAAPFPVRTVEVITPLNQASRAQIEALLARQRLERFVEAYASTAGSGPVPQVVDLRYPNGFALRVKG